MASNQSLSVSHCVLEVTPIKQESPFFESNAFTFQSSECRIRINYGWESNEGKIKIFVRSKPALSPNFFATVSVIKGSNFISCPKKPVQDPMKWIWLLLTSDIAKQFPGVDKWDLKFRFIFEQESECNYTLRNSGNKFVQTSYCSLKENRSLEKFSGDILWLLDGDTKSDVELKSGDIVIKAHKAVLRARSMFFRKELQSATGDKLELKYIDPAAFHEIIRYIYSGKLTDLSYELAKNLYKGGEMCDTGYLKERCVEFLIENLTLDNVCECLEIADDDYFKERVVKYIMEKDLPFLEEYWTPFCGRRPDLATNVLNKLVKILTMELRQYKT